MAKLKTHKSMAKRVKLTGSGKLKVRKLGWGHLKAKKNRKQALRKQGSVVLSERIRKSVARSLPGLSTKKVK